MKIDVTSLLGAVTREVVGGERDGKPVRTVVATRVYDTDAADLWSAFTTPERIVRWFSPVTGELRQGGRYQIEGNAGGTITTCKPPSHLALTWEMGPGVSWVEVTLTPRATKGSARTELRLAHTAPVEEHWEKYGPGAVGVGWELTLWGIALHVAKEVFDPKAIEAWTVGDPEGKRLISGISDGWRAAAVAFGTPAAEAARAAAFTTAFYTGAPPPA